ELGVDVRVELGDGALVDVEQVAQRVEAQGVGLGELEAVELGLAGRSPQLADLGRGDPAFGQAPEGQHGGQVLGVAFVVLHASVPPVVTQCVGEVDVGAELLEQIGGPVPAIGGLDSSTS